MHHPAQLDQRRHQRKLRNDGARYIRYGWRAQGGQIQHTVSVLHDALQAVLAEHDRQPQILVEMAQCHQHFLSGLRIKLGGRLIQHQHFWLQSQHGSDGYTLPLPPRERADPAGAQVGDAHLIQHLLDAFAHGGRHQREVLHGECQLIFHRVHHKLRLRVLENEAHQVGHTARGQRHRISAEHIDATGPSSAVKMRHQAVQAAQKSGLPRARWPDDQHKLARLDRCRKIGQRRRCLFGIGVGDVVELDQAD